MQTRRVERTSRSVATRTASGLALGLASGLALFAVAGAAQAQTSAPSQAGGGFNMPLGVDQRAATLQTPVVILRRIPIGDAALESIKSQAGGGSRDAQAAATQKQAAPPQNGAVAPEAIESNCAANVGTGYEPSDSHGAAGPINIINVTNVDIGVYNKLNCALVSRVSFKTFFGGFVIPSTQLIFDPRALYDVGSGRFFVTAESSDSGNNDQYQYFAVSTDSTGTSWYTYRFTLSEGAAFFCKAAVANFWDFPQAGYSSARWLITANDFNTGGAILSIDKAPSLVGTPPNGECFNTLAYNIAPPIVLDSSTTPFFLSPGSGSGSSITRYRLNQAANVFSDTLTTTSAISITAWTAPADPAQPNGQRLDVGEGRFENASIQNGTSLWNVHTVDNFGAVVRFYQLSTTGTSVLFTKDLFTAADDKVFTPSVAVSGSTAFVTATRLWPSQGTPTGNAAMLMITGSSTADTGWFYDLVATSATQFTQEFDGVSATVACNTAQALKTRTACRWGDYSATQIDPTYSDRAWGFSQLVTGVDSSNWINRAALSGPFPPSNDNFANATNILVGQTLSGTNVGASKEVGEPNHAGNAGGKSVWWKYTALTSGQVVIKTAGSSFDTTLGVYTGGAVNLLTQSAANDDFGSLQSQVSFSVNAGQTYFIAVDGFRHASGDIEQGTVSLKVELETLACNSREKIGDFNGDAKADMLFRRTSDGTLALYLMNGFQITAGQIIGSLGVEWNLVGLADFNGDGKVDMLFRRTDGTLVLYLMNGFQILAGQIIGSIGTEWEIVGVGDINGDGKADMMFRRRTDGMISLYLMNGFQIAAAQLLGVVGLEWRLVGLADFNGDGRADMFFRRNDGSFLLFQMNGFTIQAAQIIGSIGTEWTVIGVGDINGDGKADFLMRNGSGTINAFLMNGFTIQAAQSIGSLGSEWSLTGTGDFNGDGRADLLFRRTDGALAMYLMNGFQILAGQIIGNIGVEWDGCYGAKGALVVGSKK